MKTLQENCSVKVNESGQTRRLRRQYNVSGAFQLGTRKTMEAVPHNTETENTVDFISSGEKRIPSIPNILA